NSSLESGHSVTIAAYSNFAVKGAILAEDDVIITAMPNSKISIAEGITATNVTVDAGRGSTIELTDNGSISADNTIGLTAYDIYLKYETTPEFPALSADVINIDAWQFSTATETTDSAPIDAANALNIKAAVIGIVDADDNVKGDISVAGDINIQGQTGSDTLTINSTLESGHNVTIASDSNFAVKGAILAEDDVVITAMPNSKVTIAEGITATNVTVNAGQGSTIALTDNGSISADNTISLAAYDIYLKYEDIPELPVLNADIINIDAWQFSTATETTASAPIDAANALNIKAAVIGVVGNADINVAGDINIQGQTGNETLTINSTLESGRTVTIAAASNFAVKGAIVAEDDVIITAMPNSKIKIAEGITATNVTVNAGRGSTIVLTDNGSINADKVIDMAAYDIYLQFEEIPELPVLNADVINIDAWQFSTATETTDSAPIEANSALNIKAAVIGILDADNNPKGDIDVAGDINVKGQEGNETLTINSSLKSGRSVTINADSDLTIKGAVEAEDDVLITAEPNSRVKIIEGILGTNVTVNAGRGSTITLSENGSINADGIIDLTAYDIYLQFEETPEVPVLNASVINIDAWQFSTATEDTDSAPIEASSALNIKAAIIGLLDADDAPKGDIDVTGNINVKGQDGNDLLIIDSSLKSNRSITITSDSSIAIKGEIMGTDVSVDAGNVGTITLSAEGSINADKVIDMTAYDIYLKFEETPDTPVLNAPVINIDAWQFSTATEDTDSAPIEATSELNIQAAVIGMLDEGDNVKADIDVSGNINIRDQKGNDTLAINSTLTSGKSVTILSESDLTIKGEIQAADDVDITSASETKVSVIAPISGNNVSIDAGRGSTIIVKDGGAITADSDINLTAMDVLLQFEETPEDAVLNANIINVDAFTFSTATEDTDAAPIEAMTALNIKASQVGVLDGDSPKGEIAVSGNINIIDYAPGAELTIAADLTSNEGDVTIISNFNNVNVKGEVKAEKGAVSIDVAHSNLKLDKAITAKNAVRINAAQDTANANRNDDDQDNVLVIVDDITATDGNVVITTKGDGIKVESDATVTGDEVAMETNGDIEINGTVDAQEGVDLKTVEGDIKAEGTIKVDGYVNMRAAKGSIKATKISGNVTNGDIYAKSDITVKDDASITSTIVLTKDGNIKVEAGTDIRNSNFSAANGNVEITAKNNSILNASVQAGKIAILTAGNEIDGSTVTAYGDRGSNTITAEADYIGGDSFIAETGHIELIPRRKMYGVVAWEKQYEVRPDPEPVPEDEKPFFYRADREKGELMAHLRALPFVYFPHVRASFDGPAYDKNIDYILTGSSVIEGLPEGFGPGTLIDFNAIDKSFLWNTSDDTVQK
ncbi:MAG: hypothetical protein J6X55_04950, partial [Victivallales bacterium]|nr:hypothetical protein [Victivallales bacterium]